MTAPSRDAQRGGGTIHLVAGLAVQAATTYLFLIVAGRMLGPTGFGALSGLYILLTSVATGLFMPLEQEVARRRGAERAHGRREQGLLRRALIQGPVLAVVTVGLSLAVLPVTSAIMAGDRQLVAAFCVGLPGYAVCFAIRGELSGGGQLRRYGWMLGIDGAVRLLGILGLASVDHVTVATSGWLFALAPWAAASLTLVGWRRPAVAGGAAPAASLATPLLLLIPGSLAAQLLVNAGPLVVSLVATAAERAQAGVLLAALVLIRVPVFLFTAVQPSFLPAMSLHAAADRPDRFAGLLRRVLGWMLAFTAASSVVMTAFGPSVVALVFDFDERLGRHAFFLLTVAAGLFLVATVLAQSLIGLGRHLAATGGWLTGIAGLALGTALTDSLITTASVSFLAGAVVATLTMGLLLWRAMRSSARQSRATVQSR